MVEPSIYDQFISYIWSTCARVCFCELDPLIAAGVWPYFTVVIGMERFRQHHVEETAPLRWRLPLFTSLAQVTDDAIAFVNRRTQTSGGCSHGRHC